MTYRLDMQKTPLQELITLEKDAREFGFDWPNIDALLKQAISECAEIAATITDNEPKARMQEEIGDLLHTAVSLCVFSGFDVEDTISLTNKKFATRMQGLKQLAKERGLDSLSGKSTEFMLELWDIVKSKEKLGTS